MTPEKLKAWREGRKLNRLQAAKLLGLSRNAYTRYEEGKAKKIPLYIALACAAVSYGLKPMP